MAAAVTIIASDVFHKLFRALFMLQVRLSVQVFSFYVSYALWSRAIQKYQVGREKLVLHDLDDGANL